MQVGDRAALALRKREVKLPWENQEPNRVMIACLYKSKFRITVPRCVGYKIGQFLNALRLLYVFRVASLYGGDKHECT